MRLIITTALLIALTGCGASSDNASPSPSPSSSESAFTPAPLSEKVPADCESSGIREVLESEYGYTNMTLMPPPTNPAPDSPIRVVLENGGLGCAFVNETERVALQITWTPDDGTLFDSQASIWENYGYKSAKIPGVEGSRHLYIYRKPQSEQADGLWSVNFVTGGVWIQIFTTFGTNVESGTPIVEQAIAGIRN